jgi:hypothetical protein
VGLSLVHRPECQRGDVGIEEKLTARKLEECRLGGKSWQRRNPQSQFCVLSNLRLACTSVRRTLPSLGTCAYCTYRYLKMPPKKKVERPATENISLGPQVREGAHDCHPQPALADLLS